MARVSARYFSSKGIIATSIAASSAPDLPAHLLHLPLQPPHLLPHPRHHLSQKAEHEQREARDDEQDDQVQERAIAAQEDEALDERVDTHADAEQDGDRPRHPEEQHRLAPEAQLEPDGEEIEHPHRNPPDPELRLARVAGEQRYGPLSDPEAFGGRERPPVAGPVGAARQG